MEKKIETEEEKRSSAELLNLFKEPETLINEGPEKGIDERNNDLLSEAFGKILEGSPKEQSIQSGGLKPREAFDRLAADSRARVVAGGVDARYHSRPETIFQRIQRITKEVEELGKEIKAVEAEKEKDKFKEVEFIGNAFQELESVKLKLGEIMKSKGYDEILKWDNPSQAASILTGGLSEKLTTSLVNSLASIGDEKEKKESSDIIYELYFNKQIMELQEANKYMELEKRILNIEKTIGDWKETPEFASVSTTIDYLFQVTQNLNAPLLDERIRTLQEAIQELKKTMAQKGDEKIELDKGEIDQLYEMSEAALKYYHTLPSIVEKLGALKYLHEQSAELINRISSIESMQVTINSSIKEASELLTNVKSGLSSNLKTIEGNLKSLDQRLSKISGK